MTSLLGGMSPERFLRDHWQKKPLLVRQAVPGFGGLLDRDALLQLATRPDAISKLVIHHARRKQRWERHDGPFGSLDASMLPRRDWTLLVHGIESLVRGGWELLKRFDFIPAARVDDLMVSYAAEGGTVGPHDDRYDVFLLQGPGIRRWQVARRYDPEADPSAAIRVLRPFEAEDEWVLAPGDMLYLPPNVAHHGIAETPCFTYSVGFLAPSQAQLVESFLGWLGNTLPLDEDALYADPDRRVAKDALALDRGMLGFLDRATQTITWTPRQLEDFLGCYLTRPRPHTIFPLPSRPLGASAFAARLRKKGRLQLSLPTRGLHERGRVFINGQAHALDAGSHDALLPLLRDRTLPLPTPRALDELLYSLYQDGALTLH
ncbi:MAG: cupin domain-containing protein [Polyangia bacterium]